MFYLNMIFLKFKIVLQINVKKGSWSNLHLLKREKLLIGAQIILFVIVCLGGGWAALQSTRQSIEEVPGSRIKFTNKVQVLIDVFSSILNIG